MLLYEPDDSVRDALTVLLEGEGWELLCVGNCQELMATALTQSPVAVVSEASLPDCTPQEVLKACKMQDVPVIFTGHDLQLQSAVDMIRQGAMDFLDKPIPQSRLLDLLATLSTGKIVEQS